MHRDIGQIVQGQLLHATRDPRPVPEDLSRWVHLWTHFDPFLISSVSVSSVFSVVSSSDDARRLR
jgi:hypothetical protein